MKLVIAPKTAALPEQQVAALVPGDLNDVLLPHQHEADFKPVGLCIRRRMGGVAARVLRPAYKPARWQRRRSLWKLRRQSVQQKR